MKKSAIITFIVLMISYSLVAQQSKRFISRNFLKAVENQTRTSKGIPGPAYWQNHASYVIDASLDLKKAKLSGKGKITYFNNSPDTLQQLVFNLYQDIYRAGNSRDWDLGDQDISNGTIIKQLTINGVICDLTNRTSCQRIGTKLIAHSGSYVLPRDTVKIEVEWEIPIPVKRPVRMGKYNDSTWFIAYWYPQLAVYDDIDGWDMISYNGSVEFYNDFNDYKVNITVPDDVMVWAGGELLNPKEVFSEWVSQRLLNTTEGVVNQIITKNDLAKAQITGKNGKNIWKFTSNHVPDFTFGIGRGKCWDQTVLVLEDKTVEINSVYHASDTLFDEVASYASHSIASMSKQWPGLTFPYSRMTVFSNGRHTGGMESPMMANNSAPHDKASAFALTFHEISHSYFPFSMGTNEKKYAFMDEGWASYFPTMLSDSLFPQHLSLLHTIEKFQESAGYENDVPPMIPNQLLGGNYPSLRLASYIRPAMAYHFLRQTLGDQLFYECLRNYMITWAGKHPVPADFFNVIELTVGDKMDWYFQPWFYNFAYPDLAIRKVTKNGLLIIENIGGLPLPIDLEFKFVNRSSTHISRDASVWNTGENTVIIEFPTDSPLLEVKLGSNLIPDSNKNNNHMLFIDN